MNYNNVDDESEYNEYDMDDEYNEYYTDDEYDPYQEAREDYLADLLDQERDFNIEKFNKVIVNIGLRRNNYNKVLLDLKKIRLTFENSEIRYHFKKYVSEELMKLICHPKNINRFEDLGFFD